MDGERVTGKEAEHGEMDAEKILRILIDIYCRQENITLESLKIVRKDTLELKEEIAQNAMAGMEKVRRKQQFPADEGHNDKVIWDS